MSRRKRRAVFASELRTPEDGLDLDDREEAAVEAPAPARSPAELLAAAGVLKAPEDVPCRDCWLAGRDAAVKAAAAGGVEAARALAPSGLHWREAWMRGRNAAVEVLAGR